MFDVALDRIAQTMDEQLRDESDQPSLEAFKRLHSELLRHFGEETQLVAESRVLGANRTKLRAELRVGISVALDGFCCNFSSRHAVPSCSSAKGNDSSWRSRLLNMKDQSSNSQTKPL